MNVSDKGLRFLMRHEGVRHEIYDDANGMPWKDGDPILGYLTIGVGHLIRDGELPQFVGRTLTEDEVMDLLRDDIKTAEGAVSRNCMVDLNEQQFDSLTSWTFNCGEGNLRSSTMLRLLNAGDYDSVPAQMARWNKSKGAVMNGLVRRRESEGALWANGDYDH